MGKRVLTTAPKPTEPARRQLIRALLNLGAHTHAECELLAELGPNVPSDRIGIMLLNTNSRFRTRAAHFFFLRLGTDSVLESKAKKRVLKKKEEKKKKKKRGEASLQKFFFKGGLKGSAKEEREKAG